MSEDQGNRTHRPTQRRREQARQRGEFARSADLSGAVTMLAAILLGMAAGPAIVESLKGMLRNGLGSMALRGPLVRTDSFEPLAIVLAPLGGVTLVAIVSMLAQAGFRFTWSGSAKRLFQPPKLATTARQVMAGALKASVLLFVGYWIVGRSIEEVLAASLQPVEAICGYSGRLLGGAAIKLALAALVVGAIDYVVKRIALERRLRMTHQELQQELRETEGDPLVRRRRKLLRQKARSWKA